ncbi:MAG: hypothetical protein Q8Q33_08485, partial [Chlamydiota bacterium]|nr:hypothetical protein [Chlamydiota bacterium]
NTMRYLRVLFLLCVVFLFNLVPSVFADELSDLRSQVTAMQRQMNALQQKIDALETNRGASDIDTQVDVSALEEEGPSVQVGGYSSVEFESFENTKSTFDGLRFTLLIGADLNDRIGFYSEVEFEHLANIEAGGGGRGGEIELERAYMDYRINPWINLRGGILIIPFGEYNLNHNDPDRQLAARPVVDRRIIPSTWSDPGIGFFGEFNITEQIRANYEIYIINGLGNGISSGKGGLRKARGSFEQDINTDKAVVGRLAFNFWNDFTLGLSGYTGDYDPNGDSRLSGVAVDWNYMLEAWNLELLGEYAFFDPETGLNNEGEAVPDFLQGLYAQINYFFWFEGLNDTILGRYFEDPTFTLSFRYDWAKIEASGGDLDEHGYTIGLNYRPHINFVIKISYSFNDGDIERGDNDGFLGQIAILF